MQNENICLASEVINIAEHKTYLELTSRICYYDDVNANDMMLPFDDTSELKAATLVNMPVQAKYKTNYKGDPTFGSHEMLKDSDGNVVFNTNSIGTHTETYIQDDVVTTVNGEVKTLPCLFAKYRIWKRYKNVVAAVQRLFGLNKLYSSWEILTSAYEFKDGIKKIIDYEFEANTLLGFEYATPSYGTSASALSLATEGSQMLIAEALSQDLISESSNIKITKGGSQETMNKETKTEISEDNIEATKDDEKAEKKKKCATTDTSENITDSVDNSTDTTDISQLTDWDLRDKIREACKAKLKQWCYVAFHFPVEKEVWVEPDCRESELDYIRFTYEVNNDVVTVSDPETVQLTVSVKSINTTISELQNSIAEKDNALVKASEELSSCKTEISELQPYKETFELAEQERISAERLNKKENLIASITKSGFITKDEIQTSEELKGYVDSFDEKSLKAIIAERFIASLEEAKDAKTDIASVGTNTDTASTNLNSVEDEVDTKTIMKNYFGGK